MDYTGEVFESKPTLLASMDITEKQNYLEVSVEIGGNQVMKFPLSSDSDTNAIKSRIRNIINQTGLVTNSVSVEITEVEPPD